PTMATRGPDRTAESSANLMLRMRRPAQFAPQRPAESNYNAAAHITHRHAEQHRLRKERDQIDKAGKKNYREWRTGLQQIDVLEAGIAPRTHHQKRQKAQQKQPQR